MARTITNPGATDTSTRDVTAEALEMELQRMIISANQLQQNFNLLVKERDRLVQRLNKLQQMARQMASALIPDILAERMERDTWSPDDASPEELINLTTIEGGRILFELKRRASRDWESRARKAEEQRVELTHKVKELKDQLDSAQAQIASLERQLSVAKARITTLMTEGCTGDSADEVVDTDTLTPGENTGAQETVLLEQTEDASTDVRRVQTVVKVLAEHGTMLREDIDKVLKDRYSFPSGGSLRAIWARAKSAGLIVAQSFTIDKLGRRNLVMLTPEGERIAQEMGVTPQRSRLDELRRVHRSWEHALLILEAAMDLENAGATVVNPLPTPVALPDGGAYFPDIAAVWNGEPIYVEVERYTKKAQRRGKWDAYRAASDKFYIFVGDPRTLNMILSEITLWSMNAGQEVTVFIRDMSRPVEGKYWNVQKVIRPPSR